MIDPSRKEVRQTIGVGNAKLIVPEYQRNFNWNSSHAEDFWQDLRDSIETGKPAYLGTVVMDISKLKSEKIISVVDGQQRLTTIFILLAACRNIAVAKGNTEQANTIQSKLTFTNDTTGAPLGVRMEVSESIREVFNDTIVNPIWDGDFPTDRKRMVKKIKPLYDFFTKKLSEKGAPNIENLLGSLYSSFFVELNIEHTMEAFDIFERTNARGMELDAADLLKNYLFANKADKDLEKKWKQIVISGEGTVMRMLKYFWVSQFGYVQKKDLYSKLKGHGNKVGANVLLDDLDQFSSGYKTLVSGNHEDTKEWLLGLDIKELHKEYNYEAVYRAIEALRLFRVTQPIPLIMMLMYEIEKLGDGNAQVTATKKLLKLMSALENYHFINSAVCRRPGNEVERKYADTCPLVIKNLGEGSTIQKEIDKIIKDLKSNLAHEQEFLDNFKDVDYNSPLSLQYYFFDRLNNYNKTGAQRVVIYNTDSRITKKNFSIEHILSQDPSEHNLTEKDVKEYVHSIGNLLCISMHTNSGELKNKPIPEKIEILRNKQLHLSTVKDFTEEYKDYKWDTEELIRTMIDVRSKKLATEAYNTYWSIL